MKGFKILIIPLLIIALLGFGMDSFAELHSKWSSGDLIYYDGATNILAIKNGTDGLLVYDDIALTFGDDSDATITYDETTDNKLEITCTNGITLSGAISSVSGLSSSGQTLTPDATRTYIAYQIGNRVTEKNITMAAAASQNLDPMQFNLNIIGAAPTGSSTLNLSYAQITHDTVHMPNLRLKITDWTISVGKNVSDVYILQTELDTTGSFTAGEMIAVSAYVNLGTGAITTSDRVCALAAIISGDGTAGTVTTGVLHVAYFANRGTQIDTDAIIFINNQSSAVADVAIEFDLDGTVTNAFEFNGTVCDGWTSGDATGVDFDAQDEYVLIPVKVEGVTPQLYILAAETYN